MHSVVDRMSPFSGEVHSAAHYPYLFAYIIYWLICKMVIHLSSWSNYLLGKWQSGEQGHTGDGRKSSLHVSSVFAVYDTE